MAIIPNIVPAPGTSFGLPNPGGIPAGQPGSGVDTIGRSGTPSYFDWLKSQNASDNQNSFNKWWGQYGTSKVYGTPDNPVTGGTVAIPQLAGGASPPPSAYTSLGGTSATSPIGGAPSNVPLSGQIPITNQAPAGPGGFLNFINSNNPAALLAQAQQNQGTNVTQQAVGNNLSAGPSLASLTQLINQLNLQAQQQANAARIPNATGLETQSSGNIGSLLSGVIPQDVQTQLAQSAAERGVSLGSPGSDNVNSSLLRSLGLTSLGLQQQGQQDLTAALARNPGAPLFDPTSQLITPAQQGNLNNQANQLALEWAQLLNQINRAAAAGRGGTGQQQQQQPTAPDMSWFSRALQSAGGLNQPVGAPNIFAPPASTFDPNNPFDPLNQYQNVVSPVDYSPIDTSTVPTDTSSMFDIPDLGASFDPSLYG